MGVRPLHIGIQIRPEPVVPALDAFGILAVMHVVQLIGDDHADGRQGVEIGREVGERTIVGGQHGVDGGRLPIDPWVMFACIGSCHAIGGADGRQIFSVPDERLTGLRQGAMKIRGRQRERARVPGYSVDGSREQGDIVGLTGMGDAVGVGQQRGGRDRR